MHLFKHIFYLKSVNFMRNRFGSIEEKKEVYRVLICK